MATNKPPDMRGGYSPALIAYLKQADRAQVPVQFALFCVERGIPASAAAARLGVSRATVYNWFKGVYYPRRAAVDQMKEWMATV